MQPAVQHPSRKKTHVKMWADASMKLVIEMGTGLASYRCLLNLPASRSRGCASAGCLNCSRCLVPTWIDKTVAIDRAELLDIGKKELLTSIDNDFWIRLIRNILPQCFDSQRVWQEHWQETEGRRYPRWFWTYLSISCSVSWASGNSERC